MKAFILFALFIALSQAQPQPPNPPTPQPGPPYCQLAPVAFTADFSLNSIFKDCISLSESGLAYYDYNRKMVRVDVKGHQFGQSEFHSTIWIDYTKQIQYVINAGSQNCTSYKFNGQMPPPFPPPGSHYEGEAILGTETLRTFSFPVNSSALDEPAPLRVYGTWASNCDLVSYQVYQMQNGTAPVLLATESIYNLVPTLDPGMLNVPPQCLNASIAGTIKQQITMIRPAPFF